MRPLLDAEVAQAVKPAPWVLTDTTIGLKDRPIGRQVSAVDGKDGDAVLCKTRSELRGLDHLRRDNETVLDAVFDASATTEQVYEHSFRDIVFGTTEGLNGAILAYGQTSSGKTFSISGSSANHSNSGGKLEDSVGQKGITHLALEDLFARIRERSAAAAGRSAAPAEFLVRMSYCELYMEKVNDLLRKACPESQNLAVKEDAEAHSFYVDGLTEQVVTSPEQVLALVAQAEKRRRVAYTRYNEVSSRSHTLLTLHVESSTPMEDDASGQGEQLVEGASPDDAPLVLKVGRLVIVDLAGNERMDTGTDYMAESNSINKSLFFLGQVIEKLSSRERLGADEQEPKAIAEHVPYRDSKLTRLLSVHLGGNSQTGVLITLAPHEEYVEQSMSTLRFAHRAALVRCVPKPVFLSKEQSLIQKQREIIAELRLEVKKLKNASRDPPTMATSSSAGSCRAPSHDPEDSPTLTASPSRRTGSRPPPPASPEQRQEQEQQQVKYSPTQGYISQSKEVDAIVTALHRSNDVLRRQKATVVDEIRELHRSLTEVSKDVAQAAASFDAESPASPRRLISAHVPKEPGKQPRPWEPSMQDLRTQIQALVRVMLPGASAASAASATSEDQALRIRQLEKELEEAYDQNAIMRAALARPGSAEILWPQERIAALRMENAQLRAAQERANFSGSRSLGSTPPARGSARGRPSSSSQGEAGQQERRAASARSSAVESPDADTVSSLRAEVDQLKEHMRSLTVECDQLRGEVERTQTPKQPPNSVSDVSTRPPSGQSSKSVGSTASMELVSRHQAGSDARDRSAGGGPQPPSSSSYTLRTASPLRFTGQSVLSPTLRRECEPIVEAASTAASASSSSAKPPNSARERSKELDEFAPIVERRSPKDAAIPPPQPAAPARPPAPSAELGLRAAADYYRQVGLRGNVGASGSSKVATEAAVSHAAAGTRKAEILAPLSPSAATAADHLDPADAAHLCGAASPPKAALRSPHGGLPAASGSATPTRSGAPDMNKPVRLAPLADLCVDRPTALDQPPEGKSLPPDSACASTTLPPSTSSGSYPSPAAADATSPTKGSARSSATNNS